MIEYAEDVRWWLGSHLSRAWHTWREWCMERRGIPCAYADCPASAVMTVTLNYDEEESERIPICRAHRSLPRPAYFTSGMVLW